MEAYRFSVPKVLVRFRPLHPFLFFLSCFLFVFSAAALDFDTDNSLYYHMTLDSHDVTPFVMLRGNVFDTSFRFNTSGKITSINGISLSDMTFNDFGTIYATSLNSIFESTEQLSDQISVIDASTSALDSTLNTINTNLLAFYDYFKGNNFNIYWTNASGSTTRLTNLSFSQYLEYLSTHISGNCDKIANTIKSFQTALINSLLPIESSLNTYLPRIDKNTENLHGDNLNLLKEISSSFGLNHNDLYSLHSTLADFRLSNHSDLGVVSKDISDFHSFFTDKNFSIYWLNGNFELTRLSNMSFPTFLEYMSSSLAHNFYHVVTSLVGRDESTTISLLSIDDNGDMIEEETSFNNILDVLGFMTSSLQSPLTKLQYVLANDDDIKLRAKTQGNLDEFDDQFTESGPGAISPSDIAGVGGISGSLKSSFSDSASAADTFYVINSSDSYQFFSQAVSDSLDTVDSPTSYSALDSDFWLDDFIEDDDGFLSLRSNSAFDPFAFLRGDAK